jgi:dsDNA-binding SOS-regulon protein
MSLLEKLKEEARKRQEDEDGSSEAAILEELYQSRFKSPMQSIMRYLSELTKQLKILDYETRHDYDLPSIGPVSGLRHADYVVNADSSENTKLVRLRFNCASDNEMTFSITPKSKADEASKFLDTQTMRYSEWPIRDHEQRIVGLNLQLKVKVNINFVFQADLELGSIRMFVSNFNGFKVEKSLIQPEKVDEAWLDNLGNYILRNRADMYDLEIDESTRQAIRQRLEESKLQRQEEQREQMIREQFDREYETSKSLLDKLMSFTERGDRQ